jgi:hypothetical protein
MVYAHASIHALCAFLHPHVLVDLSKKITPFQHFETREKHKIENTPCPLLLTGTETQGKAIAKS